MLVKPKRPLTLMKYFCHIDVPVSVQHMISIYRAAQKVATNGVDVKTLQTPFEKLYTALLHLETEPLSSFQPGTCQRPALH